MIPGQGRPDVSVVLPAFNSAWSIQRCVESILREREDLKLEVIAVDDGSTDDTVPVLQSFGDAVRVIRQPNGGPGSARNAGVACARAPLVAFMDADDELLPGRLRLQADFMASHGEVVLTFGAVAFRSRPDEPYLSTLSPHDGWQVMEDPYRHLLTSGGECVNTMTAMVRREAFDKVGGFDTRYRCGEDTDLWARLAELGPFAYHGRPMALVNDTQVDGKLTRTTRVYTDGPRALIEILARDRRLAPIDRTLALRLVKRSAEMMLRYDWTDRGRAELLADIEFCRPVLGDAFALKWKLIGLVPPVVGRSLRRARRAARARSAAAVR